MAETILPKEERLRLKTRSHHLDPIVLIGAAGVSEPVVKEIDRALSAHGLIKIRAPAGPREEREQLFQNIAERLGAARIQLIGRLMVLFREKPREPPPAAIRVSAKSRGSGSRAPLPSPSLATRAKRKRKPGPAAPPAIGATRTAFRARPGAAGTGGAPRATARRAPAEALGRSLKRSERGPAKASRAVPERTAGPRVRVNGRKARAGR